MSKQSTYGCTFPLSGSSCIIIASFERLNWETRRLFCRLLSRVRGNVCHCFGSRNVWRLDALGSDDEITCHYNCCSSQRSVNMFLIVSSECIICFRRWCVGFRSHFVVITYWYCCIVTIVSMFWIRWLIALLINNYDMSSHTYDSGWYHPLSVHSVINW